MIDLALQLATELPANDVIAGPVAFDYPWGDNMSDESTPVVFAWVIHDLGKRFIREWGLVNTFEDGSE